MTKLYALITEDGIDQVCEDKTTANKERRDLHKLGCDVKIKSFNSWADFNAFEERFEA